MFAFVKIIKYLKKNGFFILKPIFPFITIDNKTFILAIPYIIFTFGILFHLYLKNHFFVLQIYFRCFLSFSSFFYFSSFLLAFHLHILIIYFTSFLDFEKYFYTGLQSLSSVSQEKCYVYHFFILHHLNFRMKNKFFFLYLQML